MARSARAQAGWDGIARYVALVAALGLAGCAGERPPAEAELRALVQEARRAAEAGDVQAFKALISERYADPLGNDRRQLAAWLSLQLMQHRALHVLERVKSLELPEPGRAELRVVAGMAGSPVDHPDDFRHMKADVYEIRLSLADEDGRWRVVRAEWRPTRAADLL